MLTASQTQRNKELRTALEKGRASNGNHSIELEEGIVKKPSYCRLCPMWSSCYIGDKTPTLTEAHAQKYACIKENKLTFRYHGSKVLVFDMHQHRLNDFGFWGYSMSTSRSITWYLHALEDTGLIAPIMRNDAAAFFRKRKDKMNSDDKNAAWYQC